MGKPLGGEDGDQAVAARVYRHCGTYSTPDFHSILSITFNIMNIFFFNYFHILVHYIIIKPLMSVTYILYICIFSVCFVSHNTKAMTIKILWSGRDPTQFHIRDQAISLLSAKCNTTTTKASLLQLLLLLISNYFIPVTFTLYKSVSHPASFLNNVRFKRCKNSGQYA